MVSVFEYLGRGVSTQTVVPELGISNSTSCLQLKSKKYFLIGKEAKAAEGNKLAVTIQENFDLNNQEHRAYLNECIDLFQEKLVLLKMLDLKIIASVITGIVATALSFFPLVSMLGLVGWGAALYHIHQRAQAYAEYHESLALLVGSCNWSLGPDSDQRANSVDELTKAAVVRKMMIQLYPVLTKTQIGHLIADDIQGIFVEELNQYNQKFQPSFKGNKFFTNPDDQIALAKQGAEFKRCLYGLNKGSFIDFLDALASALPDLFRAIRHAGQVAILKCKNWCSPATVEKPEEESVPQAAPQS